MKTYLVTLRTERTIEVVMSDRDNEFDATQRAIEAFHEDHAAGAETAPAVVNVEQTA